MDLWPSSPICQPSTHADSLHHSTFTVCQWKTPKNPDKQLLKQKQPTVTCLLLAVNGHPLCFYCEVFPPTGTLGLWACDSFDMRKYILAHRLVFERACDWKLSSLGCGVMYLYEIWGLCLQRILSMWSLLITLMLLVFWLEQGVAAIGVGDCWSHGAAIHTQLWRFIANTHIIIAFFKDILNRSHC